MPTTIACRRAWGSTTWRMRAGGCSVHCCPASSISTAASQHHSGARSFSRPRLEPARCCCRLFPAARRGMRSGERTRDEQIASARSAPLPFKLEEGRILATRKSRDFPADGPGARGRTEMTVRSNDFESFASASSATPGQEGFYHWAAHGADSRSVHSQTRPRGRCPASLTLRLRVEALAYCVHDLFRAHRLCNTQFTFSESKRFVESVTTTTGMSRVCGRA